MIESAVADASDAGVPIVLASRCVGGAAAPVWGGAGGGQTLHSHGVIDGGDLSAGKARLKRMLVLESVGGGDLNTI